MRIFQTHTFTVLLSSVGWLGLVLCCPWAASPHCVSPWHSTVAFFVKADKAFSGYLHRDAAWWKAVIQHTGREKQRRHVRLPQLSELLTITALFFWLSADSLGFVSLLTDRLCSFALNVGDTFLGNILHNWWQAWVLYFAPRNIKVVFKSRLSTSYLTLTRLAFCLSMLVIIGSFC